MFCSKVIHIKNDGFMRNQSYTRSYPQYPQKCETCFTSFYGNLQTYVPVENDEKFLKPFSLLTIKMSENFVFYLNS